MLAKARTPICLCFRFGGGVIGSGGEGGRIRRHLVAILKLVGIVPSYWELFGVVGTIVFIEEE
jgi:hypothetical protein